jgi:hypothetical protein
VKGKNPFEFSKPKQCSLDDSPTNNPMI